MCRGIKLECGFFFLWQESHNLGCNIVFEYLIIQHTSGIPLRPESLVQVPSVETIFIPALLDHSDSQIQVNFLQALSSCCLNKQTNTDLWRMQIDKQNRIRFKERETG